MRASQLTQATRRLPLLLSTLLVACGGTIAPVEPEPPGGEPAADATGAEAIEAGPERCEATPLADEHAVAVYGHPVPWHEVRVMQRLLGFDRYSAERAEELGLERLVLQGLVDRELLVHEGLRRGMELDPDAATRQVRSEEVVFATGPFQRPTGYPDGRRTVSFRRGGAFEEARFRTFVIEHLELSLDAFSRWQAREELARRVRELLADEIPIGEEEVGRIFADEQTTAGVSYIELHPRFFEPVRIDAPQLAAWHRAHAADVAAEYERQRHRYRDLPEQRRSRHLLIAVDPEASDDERAAARRRAAQLLRRVRRGREDLAELAREHSDDAGSAPRGGTLHWASRGHLVEPFEEAIFGAPRVGVIPRVVETQFGMHVIELLGIRRGDVPRAEAEREIAEELYRTERAETLALRAAEETLEAWRDGSSAEELVERLAAGRSSEPLAPTVRQATVRRADVRAPDPWELQNLSHEQVQELIRQIQGGGGSPRPAAGPEPSQVLWEALEMDAGDLPDAPRRAGRRWVVFRVMERQIADPGEVDAASRSRIERRLTAERLPALGAALRERASELGCLKIGRRAGRILAAGEP